MPEHRVEDEDSISTARMLADETERARLRRGDDGLSVRRPFGPDGRQWGLALSGGGIRSATFCLGVLQGLASRPAAPSENGAAAAGETAAADGTEAAGSWLGQFDYVSTVSGGGYIGSFFSSLFVRGRLDPNPAKDDAATARSAYRVLQEDPPARLRHDVAFDPAAPGRAALAWLRENGRYMAPNGAGDMLYAWAVHLRNWAATHYVLGAVLFTLFALLALLRSSVAAYGLAIPSLPGAESPGLFAGWAAAYAAHEESLLASALAARGSLFDAIWWSTLWWVFSASIALVLLVPGIAFWLTHPSARRAAENSGGTDEAPGMAQAPQVASRAALVAAGLGLALAALGLVTLGYRPQDAGSLPGVALGAWRALAPPMFLLGAVVMAGTAWYAFNAWRERASTVAALRVRLTRQLKSGLRFTLIVVGVALVDTAAQTIYLHWASLWKLATPAALVGAIVWVVRLVAAAGGEKGGPSWLGKLPLATIAGLVGIVLAVLVALAWALLVQWILWQGESPAPLDFADGARVGAAVFVALLMAAVGLGSLVASGCFAGFLNLSTLQGLYSSRLTRAYLGASNSRRFQPENRRYRSVAEAMKEDQLSLDALYRNRLAPMHLFNVCLNQTTDPGENLVQRDRKGRPLAIVPGGMLLDGQAYRMPRLQVESETDAALSVGEWVGVSGAAFTTGLGRGTSLGMSLLMGLANIRLGRWWRSGIFERMAVRRSEGAGRAGEKPYGIRDRGLRRVFRTQHYLLDELLAQFHGTRRELQYLSDGGHFENTAVYELLRPEREVSLIVCCDCGADPDYRFEDVANLIRLARIDHRLEIEVDQEIAAHAELGKVFGTFADFAAAAAEARSRGKCAVLMRVRSAAAGDDALIIFIKPRVLADSSLDLLHYHATHPCFPQEPTMDQFFDEAQWESYRRLGRELALRVFPSAEDTGPYATAFRDYFARRAAA